jgi:cell shape-determining protein MreC
MKRTFLAKRNALLSSSRVSLGFAVLACAIVIALIRLVFPNTFLHLAEPLARSARALTSSARIISKSFTDAGELSKRNEQLILENQILTHENKIFLERLQDLAPVESLQGVLAGVLMRPPESPYDTLVLSSGSAEGILEGMGVFSVGGVPLGVITEVTNDFSRAALLSSSGMVTRGWIGEERVPIELYGTGGGALRARLPRAVTVVAGAQVFAPGPGALPFGVVSRVDDDPSAPDITLRITPSANLFSLTWVVVRDAGRAFRGSVASSTEAQVE